MSDTAYLALLLDAPLQSWGFASRFERRTTGLHPTKSGVIGLICAAMGLAKGSGEERQILPRLAASKMMTIAIPRPAQTGPRSLSVLRLEDYHTVLGTRRASGKMNQDAVVTRREYLLDARFAAILEGPRPILERAMAALSDPVWGVWLGRKSCIPAEPIGRGLFETRAEALRNLIGDRRVEEFTAVAEVSDFAEGTDSLSDQPESFGDGRSSGLDRRRFAMRRVAVKPATRQSSIGSTPLPAEET
ncbi:MAG: type I-E CRISPR-associated protein Cas5/CasD [Bryobacteraceae bacterium]|nr:type I-E CRISPR-associated protein Cas5/CasD [Bryobacteraceae bacterium]